MQTAVLNPTVVPPDDPSPTQAAHLPPGPSPTGPAGVADRPLSPPLAFPSTVALLGGAGGHAGFALAALSFSSDGAMPLALTLAPAPIALFATQVTLAVGHQWLGLSGRPEDLPRACAGAWSNAGRFAFGLVPLLLWFATTGDPAIFDRLASLMSLSVAGVTLLGAAGAMRDALPTRAANGATTDLLIAGWFALSAAIILVLRHQFEVSP